MDGRLFPRTLAVLALGLALGLASGEATAQQLITKGMFGMKAGEQPPPGLYAGMFSAINWNSELIGPNGKSIPTQGAFDQYIFGPLLIWVTSLKVFGGDYGMLLGIPFVNTEIDFPLLPLQTSTSFGLSQLYVAPVRIGWHFDRADLTFQYAFYPPTGRYTFGASDNTSLGMWCNELSVLSTVYFDQAKDWHLSASLFYDINSRKKGVDFKTGDPLTLMWGAGRNYGRDKSLLNGWGGIVGYAQWQVTSTTGADVPRFVSDNRTRVYGIGPEITTLQGALTFRYFWQFAGSFTTQGHGLYVQFVMPIKL